ncbi:hypothetical protein BBJ28_00014796 [Nothophytophthora sp. Chile5]|nr:hypothetical protein BBJ28_00014796 [Nothophytophthora sp. Chile5]
MNRTITGVGDSPLSLTFVPENRNQAGHKLPIAQTLNATSTLATVYELPIITGLQDSGAVVSDCDCVYLLFVGHRELVNIDLFTTVTTISSFMPSSTTSIYIQGNEIADFTVNETVFEKIASLTAFTSDLADNSASCNGGRWQSAHDLQFCVTSNSSLPAQGAVVVVLLVCVLTWQWLSYKKDRSSETPHDHLYSVFDSALNSHETMRVRLTVDPIIATNRLDYDEVKLGQCISRGGFGLVFHGTYHRRQVAVKKIRVSSETEAAQIEQFIKEIMLMAVLRHPRIVEFIGVAWEALVDLSAVTELMERGDLSTVLHSFRQHGYRLAWGDHKTTIALHIAEALAYLHSLSPKVIHRDLKSKNVLLNTAMDAKISDFGISRERHVIETHMTAGMGTSFWIAPEVLNGQDYDERADVFSFGVVLSELDTDDFPYWNAANPPGGKLEEGNILQLVAAGKKRPAFSAGCPPPILELAHRCLQRKPGDRPSAEELVRILEELELMAFSSSSNNGSVDSGASSLSMDIID